MTLPVATAAATRPTVFSVLTSIAQTEPPAGLILVGVCADWYKGLGFACRRRPTRRAIPGAADAGSVSINGAWYYLRHVLERIADHPVKRVHELLPWNVAGIRLRLDQRDAA